MKIFTILLIFSTLTLSGQDVEYKYWILQQKLPDWSVKKFEELSLGDKYLISDFINPFYLEQDFNGDNKPDVAVAIIQKDSEKKGILIIHHSKSEYFIIGAGTKFINDSDDLNWMDIWKISWEQNVEELIYNDTTQELDSKYINIKYPCLDIKKSESSSGLIYWDGKKYKWAQTSD